MFSVGQHYVEVDPKVSQITCSFDHSSIQCDCWHYIACCSVVKSAPQCVCLYRNIVLWKHKTVSIEPCNAELWEQSATQSKSVSNLVFYAQSTITIRSGRDIFCYYTIIVKNMYALNLVYIHIKKILKKRLKHRYIF